MILSYLLKDLSKRLTNSMLAWVTDLVQRDPVSNSSKIKSKKKAVDASPLFSTCPSTYGARFILRSSIKDKVNKQMKRR